jgi:hypothetical protein
MFDGGHGGRVLMVVIINVKVMVDENHEIR